MNLKPLNTYQTAVFDCDGVILDSNAVKSAAFYTVALPYGKEIADAFLTYHKANAGISRFKKIRHLHEEVLKSSDLENKVQSDIKAFGDIVSKLLGETNTTAGFDDLIGTFHRNCKLYVVTGGEESEAKVALAQKGILPKFDALYGSPRPKDEILQKLVGQGGLPLPGVYFGDSKFDFEMAGKFGLDFVFVSKYSEFEGWEKFFADKNVKIVGTLRELLVEQN
jgi:phosphoglycolate phosphatase-like HAD superfamily hydrolase